LPRRSAFERKVLTPCFSGPELLSIGAEGVNGSQICYAFMAAEMAILENACLVIPAPSRGISRREEKGSV